MSINLCRELDDPAGEWRVLRLYELEENRSYAPLAALPELSDLLSAAKKCQNDFRVEMTKPNPTLFLVRCLSKILIWAVLVVRSKPTADNLLMPL